MKYLYTLRLPLNINHSAEKDHLNSFSSFLLLISWSIIIQTGTESSECTPGSTPDNKLPCENNSFWKTGEESNAHLQSVKSKDRLLQGDKCATAAYSSRKRKMAKVCEKHKESGDKVYWRQLCWQQRRVSRSVYQVLHKASPEVRLSRLRCQITLPEQNNRKVSFDTCVIFMKCQQD